MSSSLSSRPLTSRQETFARQFCATGNAAEAARRAGYAAGSARQTGHDLLNRPWVIERIRAIREAWRQTAQSEAAILLARLEQAWDVAVANRSAGQMLQVIRLQAEIAGLSRKGAMARADLWDAPGDGMGEEAGIGPEAASSLASAVRQGRDRAERARADHRRQVRARRSDPAFDAAAHLARQRHLDRAIDERRMLLRRARPHDTLTDHDIALHSHAPEPVRDGDNALVDAAEAGYLAQTRSSGPELAVGPHDVVPGKDITVEGGNAAPGAPRSIALQLASG